MNIIKFFVHSFFLSILCSFLPVCPATLATIDPILQKKVKTLSAPQLQILANFLYITTDKIINQTCAQAQSLKLLTKTLAIAYLTHVDQLSATQGVINILQTHTPDAEFVQNIFIQRQQLALTLDQCHKYIANLNDEQVEDIIKHIQLLEQLTASSGSSKQFFPEITPPHHPIVDSLTELIGLINTPENDVNLPIEKAASGYLNSIELFIYSLKDIVKTAQYITDSLTRKKQLYTLLYQYVTSYMQQQKLASEYFRQMFNEHGLIFLEENIPLLPLELEKYIH